MTGKFLCKVTVPMHSGGSLGIHGGVSIGKKKKESRRGGEGTGIKSSRKEKRNNSHKKPINKNHIISRAF